MSLGAIPSRLRSQRGSISAELVGMVPLMLIVALLLWQLLLVAWTATSASNAARAASRAESLGDDGVDAARDALSGPLRAGAKTTIDGERATVKVEVPIIAPGIGQDDLTISKSAELPSG